MIRKSLKSALPALRPVSPATSNETPRGVFNLTGANAANLRINTNYEVNRSLFIKDKKEMEAKIQKHLAATSNPAKFQTQLTDEITPEEPVEEEEKNEYQDEPEQPKISYAEGNPDLLMIESLLDRIPLPNISIPLDMIYKITPVLDRVLCVVSNWSPDYIESIKANKTIEELHSRLFALIDVDDFLTRTIICRILLSFATDSSSPLLLPIARIFYKLSCDQSNDQFFVDESLESALLSILKMEQLEARVFAAGAIRNIASCAEMREKLDTPDFFNISFDIINDPKTDAHLKAQILGAVRHMCKHAGFRSKMVESHFISMAIRDKSIHLDCLRLISCVNGLDSEEKRDLLKILDDDELDDLPKKRLMMKCLVSLSHDNETSLDIAKFVLKMLNIAANDAEILQSALNLALECTRSKENIELFQLDPIFIRIVESSEVDTTICVIAYQIIKKFEGEQFKKILVEHSLLEEIDFN